MNSRNILVLALLLCAAWAAQAQHAALNMQKLGTWQSLPGRVYNDIWGYAADGREYAIIGSNWGTHFIDITDPENPAEVASFAGASGNITGYNSSWRDFKTYSHYVYGVADAGAHTLQIFDMSGHPNNITKIYDSNTLSSSAHTVAQEGNRLYLINNRRNGTTRAIDILSLADPENPTFLASVAGPMFYEMHAIHVRNDTAYCSYGNNGLFIVDLTNPSAPQMVSSITNYPGSGYNHTAWTSGDRKTLIFTDEVPSGLPAKAFDITDISNPVLKSTFSTGTLATPHNTFMIGDIAILSYYMDGVQVWDMADAENPVRIGYFDTFPDNDSTHAGYNSPTPWNGNWGVYPYLPSGNIIASDKKYGLYVLTPPYAVNAVAPEAEEAQIIIYPNPASGHFRVLTPANQPETMFTLFNSLGQPVHTQRATGTETGISTNGLAAGLYTLRISSGSKTYCRKLIIN